MIDFRYHLVSLVAVFLALAVGVALGAGPLQSGLGETLTSQVDRLRTEKDDLRAQLDANAQQLQSRDAFTTAIAPTLVGQRLGGRSVVLVSLPGADGKELDELTTMLKAAGASVTGRVDIKADFVDNGKRALRDQLTKQFPSLLPQGGSTLEADVASVLTRAVVTGEVANAGSADANANTAFEAFKAAGLISADGDVTKRATLAVVVPGTADPKANPADVKQALAGYTALVQALDSGSNGAVVAGPTGAADQGGLIAAVRGAQPVAQAVSTVDDADAPMGQVAVILALREQMSGGAGQYGTAKGAKALLPPLPAPATG